MAKCPKCNADMDAMATVCPECGWDFPLDESQNVGVKRFLWAHSTLADVGLIVGMVAALISCIILLVIGVCSFFRGKLWLSLVECPLAFLLCFAMFVLFARSLETD